MERTRGAEKRRVFQVWDWTHGKARPAAQARHQILEHLQHHARTSNSHRKNFKQETMQICLRKLALVPVRPGREWVNTEAGICLEAATGCHMRHRDSREADGDQSGRRAGLGGLPLGG